MVFLQANEADRTFLDLVKSAVLFWQAAASA
jgi:hypothetical protein